MISKDNFKTILAVLALLALFIFSYLKTKNEKDFDAFTLKLISGEKIVTLNELKNNKLVLLYFGFLSCPDACPTTLNTIANVFKELPQSSLDKISFVFVDLDPERDTMKALLEYSAYFHPKILPVRLPLDELNYFTRFFGVTFTKVPLKSSMGYTIDHSTDIIVLSPEGKILAPIHHGTPKAATLAQVNQLINENFKP